MAVVVLPDFPLPATTGLHIRMLANMQILRALGERIDVAYFATEDRQGDPSELASFADSCELVATRRPYEDFSIRERVRQRIRFAVRALAYQPGDEYPFSLPYDAVSGEPRVAAVVRRREANTVLLPSILIHYAKTLAAEDVRVIADAADVLTDQSRQFLAIYGRRSPLRIPGLTANYLACRSQERLFLPFCDEVWANAEWTAARLRDLVPGVRVIIVGNVLDGDSVRATPLPATPDIGFIGTYTYAPNLDAACYLVDEVMPRVVARVAEARLKLAGAGLPAKIARRFTDTGWVDILGRVANAAEFVHSCRALAFPLFVRSGPPLKLVEAMACGRPSVASSHITQGLPLTDGKDVLVGRSAEEFAELLAHVLSDDSAAASIGAAARRTFERTFSLAAAIKSARSTSVLAQ
jgi:glycosyltransferase involved in cell wall biosynthesis